MKTFFLMAFVSVLFLKSNAQSFFRPKEPTQLVIDLAVATGVKREIVLKTGEYVVVLENAIPGKKYSVSVVKENNQPDPLSLPQGTFKEPGESQGISPCKRINELMTSVNEAPNEQDLKSKATELAGEIRKAESKKPPYDKSACESEALKSAKEQLAGLRRTSESSFELRDDQKVTVTVSTVDAQPASQWTLVYITERKREAVITFGWLAYSAKWPYEEKTYFLAAVPPVAPTDPNAPPTPQLYRVTKSHSGKVFYPAASIMFSYRPTKYKGASIRPVFGIGTNASDINFLCGGQLLVAHNYALNAGFIFTNQKVLNGKYKEGDDLTETLSDEQLHDNRFVPVFFMGISLRFNENPRSSRSQD